MDAETTPLNPTEISYGGNDSCYNTPAGSSHTGRVNDKSRHDAATDEDPHDDGDGEWISLHRRGRTASIDNIMESLADVKDQIIETVDEVKEHIEEVYEEVKVVTHNVIEEVQEVIAEEVAEPIKPREEGEHSEKLSALALAVLVFYKVSGGPFGCEPTVKAGGPFFALLGFIVFPFLWCIPEALVTAELGAAYPEPSGAVAWVEEAFGPRAGLLSGYFHWVSGATDNAIYPSLFLEYVAEYVGVRGNLLRFVFSGTMSIVLACINYTGLEIVGKVSMVICAISMSPFILLCICGIPNLDISRWFVMPEPGITLDDDETSGWFPEALWLGVMWRPLLNNLWWNLNSFDVGASFAGEVQDPERVFPQAMFLSVIMVTLSYILPLLAAIGATDSDQADWNAGYFTTAATDIAGPWLGAWLIFAAAVSNIALFEAELSGDAYQLMGMADRGLIPKFFCKRSRYNTPTNGILLGSLVIIAMGIANFDQLVEMLNFAYAIAMLMEFAAFIKLRITDGDVERPYKVPFGTSGCILFVIPPSLICIYLMLMASKMTYVYFTMLSLCGLLFVWLQKFAKHYGWVAYAEPLPKRSKTPLTSSSKL